MKKKILAALAVFAILIIAILPTAINHFGKDFTEHLLEKSLKVDVDIINFKASYINKSVRINDLRIHNPDGYKTPLAFELKELFIQLKEWPKGERLYLDTVLIDGLQVFLEQTKGDANLKTLLDNMDAKKQSPKKPPLLKVRKLQSQNVAISANSDLFNKKIALPDLAFTDLGGTSGAPINKVLKTILGQLFKDSLKHSMNKALTTEALKNATEKLKKGEDLKEKLKQDAREKGKDLKEKLQKKSTNLF